MTRPSIGDQATTLPIELDDNLARVILNSVLTQSVDGPRTHTHTHTVQCAVESHFSTAISGQ